MDDLPIGRYGTIHYMSSNGSETPLASYPVDEPVINLGRSDHNTCHIRLFDRWCSDIHCRLVFEEGKAFLVVLGQNGAVVDGSNIMPSLNEASPTTVPLTNGSEWLIFKRRFIFQYPPKDQRAKLMATPHRKSRKSLRMSMINAAQLWTPSAPKTQAESWQRLRDPVQPFPGENGGEITLVEGEPVHLSHNQEEVIVVENIDAPAPAEPEVAPPSSARKPPQTPGKRGPANLHKQVLLMNSHRKHVKNSDELEEREVEESILVEDNSDEELEEDAASNPFIGKTPSRTEKEVAVKLEEPGVGLGGGSLTAKSFRSSLGAIGSILPFGRPSGVVHSPNPPTNATQDPLEDHEVEPVGGTGQPATPSNKRSLDSFLTPQVPRGEQQSLPRQSMSGGATSYMNLDNDIEQARRRLATLATVERPHMVTETLDEPPKGPSRSTKKPRVSLADVPELSSPLPSSKGRFGMAPMATISEPGTGQMLEDDDEGVDDTASRLQRLMRTVENETRREAIRESRQSMANPVEFYKPVGRTSPTKHTISAGIDKGHVNPVVGPSRASYGKTQPAQPNPVADTTRTLRQAEQEEESDTSAKDSEIAIVPKAKRTGRAPTKHSAPVTGKRTAHAVETPEDQMQVDEPAVTLEDVQMEDVEERPAKKARTTRKAKTPEAVAAPRVRRSTKKAIALVEGDNADEESGEVEENTSVSTSRSRRNLKVDVTAENQSTRPAAAAPTRRGGRAKATPTVDSVDEDHSGSSVSGLVESEPVGSRGKGRGRKVATKAVAEPTNDSIQDDEGDDLDLLAPQKAQKAPARRLGGRGKAPQKAQPDSALADEDVSTNAGATKVVPKKAPARGKAKAAAVVVAEQENLSADSEPVAPLKPKAAVKTTRKAVVKKEDVAENSSDAKPRRITRTKR